LVVKKAAYLAVLKENTTEFLLVLRLVAEKVS